MNDEISVPIELPLDSDGFLRRECPTCEHEFKWFAHDEGDVEAEPVEQYFCPLCGQADGPDSWWTPAQLDYAEAVAAPEIEQLTQDAIGRAFQGVKGMTFKPDPSFTLGIDTPDPLHEPDDMVAVMPPCHPHEPVKVPGDATGRIYCLICGSPFAA